MTLKFARLAVAAAAQAIAPALAVDSVGATGEE